MSSCDLSFLDDSSSNEEYDMIEEEDIALLVTMHKKKRPKNGGFAFGRELLRSDRQEAHTRLMHNYFGPNAVHLER